MRSARDDYGARGPVYGEARAILEARCEVPPSLELFEQQLKDERKKDSSRDPVSCARALAASYSRVTWESESASD